MHGSASHFPVEVVQELGGVSGPCRAIADPRREGVGSLPAAAHEALDAGRSGDLAGRLCRFCMRNAQGSKNPKCSVVLDVCEIMLTWHQYFITFRYFESP